MPHDAPDQLSPSAALRKDTSSHISAADAQILHRAASATLERECMQRRHSLASEVSRERSASMHAAPDRRSTMPSRALSMHASAPCMRQGGASEMSGAGAAVVNHRPSDGVALNSNSPSAQQAAGPRNNVSMFTLAQQVHNPAAKSASLQPATAHPHHMHAFSTPATPMESPGSHSLQRSMQMVNALSSQQQQAPQHTAQTDAGCNQMFNNSSGVCTTGDAAPASTRRAAQCVTTGAQHSTHHSAQHIIPHSEPHAQTSIQHSVPVPHHTQHVRQELVKPCHLMEAAPQKHAMHAALLSETCAPQPQIMHAPKPQATGAPQSQTKPCGTPREPSITQVAAARRQIVQNMSKEQLQEIYNRYMAQKQKKPQPSQTAKQHLEGECMGDVRVRGGGQAHSGLSSGRTGNSAGNNSGHDGSGAVTGAVADGGGVDQNQRVCVHNQNTVMHASHSSGGVAGAGGPIAPTHMHAGHAGAGPSGTTELQQAAQRLRAGMVMGGQRHGQRGVVIGGAGSAEMHVPDSSERFEDRGVKWPWNGKLVLLIDHEKWSQLVAVPQPGM